MLNVLLVFVQSVHESRSIHDDEKELGLSTLWISNELDVSCVLLDWLSILLINGVHAKTDKYDSKTCGMSC